MKNEEYGSHAECGGAADERAEVPRERERSQDRTAKSGHVDRIIHYVLCVSVFHLPYH